MNYLLGLKVLTAGLSMLTLSGCQLAEMASYSWHNSDAVVQWTENENRAELPFTLVNNHILVKVSVNNSSPMTFVLDSGAAATVITETHATNALKLPKDNKITISGSGNGKDPVAYIVNNTLLKVGDLAIRDMAVIYAPTNAMPFDSYAETYFDGVLGADFFNCCLVEIDYDRHMLVFHENTSEQRKSFSGPQWQNLKIEVNGNTPYLHTRVEDSEGEKAVKVILDTGSTGTLSLFNTNGDFVAPEITYQARSRGISGESINQVGRLKSLTFGKYQFTALPADFQTSGSHLQDDSQGILGNQVMQNFNQVFDFDGENYWVKPTQRHSKKLLPDRSGLRLLPHVQGAIIKDIAAGTAAETLGTGVGTIVTHIDGEKLVRDNFDKLTQRLRATERQEVSLCWNVEASQQCGEIQLRDRLPKG